MLHVLKTNTMLSLYHLSGAPQKPQARKSSQSSSQPFLPVPAYVLATEVKCPTGSCPNGGTTVSPQPAASPRSCRSCPQGAVPFLSQQDLPFQEMSAVGTPSLPQSTAFLKHYCRSCPTGAVHTGSTSSPASPLIPGSPTEIVPQQKPGRTSYP